MQNISVECLIGRSWNISTRKWEGTLVNGTLIDISTQSEEDNSGKLIPVGIVLLDDDTFQCIPMEFITKINSI